MKKTNYINKLVRDNIPELIKKEKRLAISRQLSSTEFYIALKEKLKEEVEEFLETEHPEELADIIEVVLALAKCKGFSYEQLEQVRLKKLKKGGGFSNKIFLIGTEFSD